MFGYIFLKLEFTVKVFKLIFIVVRVIYFFLPRLTWIENNSGNEGNFVFFLDMFPEIIFIATYLLLVASWYERAKRMEKGEAN